jgi:hypothetical protein
MAWQNEMTVFLIMWKSKRSGATLSELKKSEEGKNSFVRALIFMGVDPDTIVIQEQEKPYKYVPKSERGKR